MIAVLAFGAVGRALAAGEFGILNVEAVFARYERTAALESAFERRTGEIKERATARARELEANRLTLQQAYQPGTPEHRAKQNEITKAEIEFRIMRGVEDEQLKNDHRDSLRSIYEDVRAAVAEVAKEKNLDVVLTYDKLTEEAPDSTTLRQQILMEKVIYWKPELDMTEMVITRLNDRFRRSGKTEPATPGSPPKPTISEPAESSKRP